MDTRSGLPQGNVPGGDQCVYCGGASDTGDHAPPKCFLKSPRPSNLITLPACQKCNNGFSFDENLTRAILTIVSPHADLVAERSPGGRLERALDRDARLRATIDACRLADGGLQLQGAAAVGVTRVLRKTVRGLYFGTYKRLVPDGQFEVLRIYDQRQVTVDDLVNEMRPSGFRDITDEPLSTISPSAWMVREPVFVMKMAPVEGDGPPVERIFRLVRETKVDWINLQPGIFRFGFVQHEDGRAVCILDVWQTLGVAVAGPWPQDRGTFRKGQKNQFSRDAERG